MADQVQVAGVIIRNDAGYYLLVQEKQAKAYGLWNMPAGHVDPGETLQQAAIREALEETGYTVELLSDESIIIDSDTEANRLKYSFVARITGGKLTLQPDEILGAGWFSATQVQSLADQAMLRSPWTLKTVHAMERDENSRH